MDFLFQNKRSIEFLCKSRFKFWKNCSGCKETQDYEHASHFRESRTSVYCSLFILANQWDFVVRRDGGFRICSEKFSAEAVSSKSQFNWKLKNKVNFQSSKRCCFSFVSSHVFGIIWRVLLVRVVYFLAMYDYMKVQQLGSTCESPRWNASKTEKYGKNLDLAGVREK